MALVGLFQSGYKVAGLLGVWHWKYCDVQGANDLNVFSFNQFMIRALHPDWKDDGSWIDLSFLIGGGSN